ncbi:MAG TPA: ABC transporter permease subunit [Candidatus Limnocylindrales bacterium]|jgi:ABC-type transport system involved in multi-copper enzyme maturation permease subunit|nr:ABC transporter permease subunit [Candidatus Limnocylindrales bacterium]
MTAAVARPTRFGRLRGGFSTLGSGIGAVVAKELRGRMRGRRAFAIVTVYLVLLSVFTWGIYEFQRQINAWRFAPGAFDPSFGGSLVPLSATVGQAIFSGLLVLETLLILVLAPALTSGAISLEREKQTLDLLVTTPLSRLALVVGKLVSALTYVVLLILASIPLSAIVFTFGGVGPEDIARAYLFLFAVAFGTGSIALFWSALLKRTQAATVITYLTVLGLTLGATVVYVFWFAMAQQASPGLFDDRTLTTRRPPEAVMWFNPFIGDLDLICGTSIAGIDPTCEMVNVVTGRSSPFATEPVPVGIEAAGDCPPNARCLPADGGAIGAPVKPGVDPFELLRDTFWPRSAIAFTSLGLILTLLSSRLVTPAVRRYRRFRR